MEYLNNFTPSSTSLDEVQSSKEFARLIILDTLQDLKMNHPEIKGVDLSFEYDHVVLKGSEVYVEFTDYKDEPVRKKFTASGIPGMTEPNFTAAEMFYNLLKTEVDLNGGTCFFKSIEFVQDLNENGKVVPLYKVEFGIK